MASRKKRNIKTHPRVRGETDASDDFMPPDRPDVGSASEAPDDATAEVVDFGTAKTVQVKGEKDGEGGDDEGAAPASQVIRRGEDSAAAAPPRRQAREDAAAQRRGRQDQDDDDGGDGDDSGYSRKVQKRIKRERAIVNRERALREAAQRELETERTARQELADRVLKIERTSKVAASDTDVKALKGQIEALVPQIAAAKEAGNTVEELRLQIKLGELQGDLKVMEYDRRLRAENAAIVEENERKQAAARAAAAARGGAGQANADLEAEGKDFGKEFMRANRHWWRRNKDAREAARQIDIEILAELADDELDFEPYSDEHAEELAMRLHEEFPDLEICDLEREVYEFDDDQQRDARGGDRRGARVANNQRRGGPQGGNGRGAPSRLGQSRQTPSAVDLARQGKVILTDADFKQMRVYKLDPNNPEHKKAFAQERARTILSEAAEAEGARR